MIDILIKSLVVSDHLYVLYNLINYVTRFVRGYRSVEYEITKWVKYEMDIECMSQRIRRTDDTEKYP